MTSEIKTSYNLVVLETPEVKFGEVKTDDNKTRKEDWRQRWVVCYHMYPRDLVQLT